MMFVSLLVSVVVVIVSVIFWQRQKRKIEAKPMTEVAAVRHTASNGFQTIILHSSYKVILEESLNLQMRSDDVVVATYPKSGTTWIQEIVWLISNNADTHAAKQSSIINRWVFLELPDMDAPLKAIESLKAFPTNRRRFIKTHLPFKLLPNEIQNNSKCKMIYLARNPKDTCVSFYHFHRMSKLLPEPGTWSEFLDDFCSGRTLWGGWFEHVSKYWKMHQERQDSIYFATFEELKNDLRGEVVKIARFLEKSLTDQQIDVIVRHCSFESMSSNKSTNYTELDGISLDFKVSKFMRRGKVGDWKNQFTINENKAFDKLYQEKTKDWVLKFEFEPAKTPDLVKN